MRGRGRRVPASACPASRPDGLRRGLWRLVLGKGEGWGPDVPRTGPGVARRAESHPATLWGTRPQSTLLPGGSGRLPPRGHWRGGGALEVALWPASPPASFGVTAPHRQLVSPGSRRPPAPARVPDEAGRPRWAPRRSCGLTSRTCGGRRLPARPAATDAASWRPRDLAPLPEPATGASARDRQIHPGRRGGRAWGASRAGRGRLQPGAVNQVTDLINFVPGGFFSFS